MFLDSLVLLGAAIGGGLAVRFFKNSEHWDIKLPLVFAGAYIFSLTIIHILPELFETEVPNFHLGLCVLIGFFFQHLLEFFTSGVEHGHMHVHPEEHNHGSFAGYSLMVALCLHSLLEGTLLAYPAVLHTGHESSSLLIGVVLHKAPAGLALMSVLTCQYQGKLSPYAFLLLFAVASPIGLLLGNYMEPMGWLDTEGAILLFAFVGGNFLHISTTIFIESSPDHSWNFKRLFVITLGSGIAILAEMYA